MLRNMYPFEAKPITIGYVAVNMALVLLISFLNTKSLVSVVVIGYVISIPYALYVIYTIIKRFVTKARFRRADLLTFTGFAILIASLTIEALLSRSTPFITNFGLVPTCMLIFVLITAVSISIRIQEQKAALAESRSRAEMLTRMNDMNLDFFHKIAHELKTPLTIISGYAQLTALEISANKLSDETLANLKTIQTEAMRLSGMVTNLMSYSCGKNDSPVFSSVSVSDLLTRVGAISVPMCLKNNNRIVVKGKDCDDVYGNEEMLLQVFINLVINANRHTKDGTISISASDTESNEYVVFRIKDTGDGISDDILPNIFKKGHSGDGGSGLGLAICREAVELHGGTNGGNGTPHCCGECRGSLLTRGGHGTARGHGTQQRPHVGRRHHLEELVRRIARKAAYLRCRIVEAYAMLRTKSHHAITVEAVLAPHNEAVAVAIKDRSHDAPHVVVEIGVEKLHRPPSPLGRETAEHKQAASFRQEGIQRMPFDGTHLQLNHCS